MRKLVVCCLLTLISSLPILSRPAGSAFPDLQGPYLGQPPPGMTPVVFAPGIVSTAAWECAGTFSPDGKEFFFTRRPTWEGSDNRIYHTKELAGQWAQPAPAPFAAESMEYEPSFAPDGRTLFFTSKRAKPAGVILAGYIWYVEKTGSGWSSAKYLNATINDTSWNLYPTVTVNGTIYCEAMFDRKYGIFRSLRQENSFSKPELVVSRSGHPFIAPDESYIIFDAPDGNTGPLLTKKSLFIVYANPDGSWTHRIKLSPSVNATKTEMAASVTIDGKYLFFYRSDGKNGNIYWVDARILKESKPAEIKQ